MDKYIKLAEPEQGPYSFLQYSGEVPQTFLNYLKTYQPAVTVEPSQPDSDDLVLRYKLLIQPLSAEIVRIKKGMFIGWRDRDNCFCIYPKHVIDEQFVSMDQLAAAPDDCDEDKALKSRLRAIMGGQHDSLVEASPEAPLYTTESRYRDLLNLLGVQGHDGAVAEIAALRRTAGMEMRDSFGPGLIKEYTHRPTKVHAVQYIGGLENQAELVQALRDFGISCDPTGNNIAIFLNDDVLLVERSDVIVIEVAYEIDDLKAMNIQKMQIDEFARCYEIISR